MNLANQLTIARLVGVAPIMLAMYIPVPGARTLAVILYVAALATDYFDGIAARNSNKVTNFGKLMDSSTASSTASKAPLASPRALP